MGTHTLDSFSLLQSGQTEYRRWAFESAALDLALRQAGLSLAEALGRPMQPLRFVVSTRSTAVESLARALSRAALQARSRPRVAGRAWSSTLAATGCVDTLDFKGVYRAEFGSPPDAELYGRIATAFPTAWLEDPALTPETPAVLDAHRDRITWDAAIHEWSDVEALPFAPRCLNCKPSRFGSVRRLFDFYDALRASTASRSTAAASSSSAPAATRSSCSPRSSMPTPRTTSRRAAYNVRAPVAGLPASPLTLEPTPGF